MSALWKSYGRQIKMSTFKLIEMVTDKSFIVLNNVVHIFRSYRDKEHLCSNLKKDCTVYFKYNDNLPDIHVIEAYGVCCTIKAVIIFSNQLELKFKNSEEIK